MSEAARQLAFEEVNIGPQPGPQTDFMMTTADIAIYGGAAGGGKTFGLLLDDIRHYNIPAFASVTFRRNATQIRNEGGLWDESMKLYPYLAGDPVKAFLTWTFPSGARARFAHLEYESTVLDWQGTAIPLLKFDELTHFSMAQFFYMLTRNRSTCGIRPYVRATCNPDPDSWVRKFIDWWIGEDGYPIKERAGKIRWFIRRDEKLYWANDPSDLYLKFGAGADIRPKSVTFIPSKLEDNKILMEKDPGYEANLLAQDRVTRARLRDGNWNVRATAGTLFQRKWFRIVETIPGGWVKIVRFWDRAATKPNETNKDPDWTRGIKIYLYPNGRWLIADLKSERDTPGRVETLIKNTASHDGGNTVIVCQQDPGSAGVAEAEYFKRMLIGYDVHTRTYSKDKGTRAKPLSAQCEAGSVDVLRAPWNDEFFYELENFSEDEDDYDHDDIVDATSGAFNETLGGGSLIDAYARKR